MTLWEALLTVPTALSSPAAIGLYGALLIAATILTVLAELHLIAESGPRPVDAAVAAACVAAIWLAIGFITWAGSSASPTEWVAR